MSGQDWPHDPDGEEGSEGMRKYGHAVIAKKIDEDEDFPFDVDAFVDEYGDDPVRIDYETVVSVREVFAGVEGDGFEDFVALHKALVTTSESAVRSRPRTVSARRRRSATERRSAPRPLHVNMAGTALRRGGPP